MFILTDGKNYVMENPLKSGEYISTTSPIQATDFSYKQARGLQQRKGKKYSWIREYQLVDTNTGESFVKTNYKGNGGVYIGEKDIDFDESLLGKIVEETESVLGLAGWNIQQLNTYKNLLEAALTK